MKLGTLNADGILKFSDFLDSINTLVTFRCSVNVINLYIS
jgi:hypothetical protein